MTRRPLKRRSASRRGKLDLKGYASQAPADTLLVGKILRAEIAFEVGLGPPTDLISCSLGDEPGSVHSLGVHRFLGSCLQHQVERSLGGSPEFAEAAFGHHLAQPRFARLRAEG